MQTDELLEPTIHIKTPKAMTVPATMAEQIKLSLLSLMLVHGSLASMQIQSANVRTANCQLDTAFPYTVLSSSQQRLAPSAALPSPGNAWHPAGQLLVDVHVHIRFRFSQLLLGVTAHS